MSGFRTGQRQHRLVSAPLLTDDYVRAQNGRVAMAGLVYTFGAPKKGKANSFDYDP